MKRAANDQILVTEPDSNVLTLVTWVSCRFNILAILKMQFISFRQLSKTFYRSIDVICARL